MTQAPYSERDGELLITGYGLALLLGISSKTVVSFERKDGAAHIPMEIVRQGRRRVRELMAALNTTSLKVCLDHLVWQEKAAGVAGGIVPDET